MYSGYNAYDRPLAQRQVTQVSDPNTAWYAQEAHWILIEDLQVRHLRDAQKASPLPAARA
jgi:hypothetical protein